jgi:hypothetical protein
MSRIVAGALLLTLVAAGCTTVAPPRMHAHDFVARLDGDPVRFYRDFDGKRVIILGHVASKNLVSQTRTHYDAVTFGPILTGELKQSTDVLTAVEFDPSRRVVCYFEGSETDSVANIEIGQRAFFDCRVAGISSDRNQRVIQLDLCKVVDP